MTAIVAVPLLVALATLVSRRFGHLAGGVLAGLPLTSAPLSLALAHAHGGAFAARAAVGSLLGIAAATIACVAYARAASRHGAGVCVALALGVFAAGVAAGLVWRPGLVPAALAGLAAAALGAATLGGVRTRSAGPPPVLGVVPRVLAALVVVVAVLACARAVGPLAAGAITPLPVVIGVLTVFAHRGHGAVAAADVVRGSLLGTVGFVAFFVVVGARAGDGGLVGAYALATGCALACGLAGALAAGARRRSV